MLVVLLNHVIGRNSTIHVLGNSASILPIRKFFRKELTRLKSLLKWLKEGMIANGSQLMNLTRSYSKNSYGYGKME